MHFLIVNDEPHIQDYSRYHLADRLGHTIRLEANGKDAVDAYMAEPADAVFMNVIMPLMDGIEATRLILEHDPNARVVVNSANSSYQIPAFEAGALAFVSVPFYMGPVADLLVALGEHRKTNPPYNPVSLCTIESSSALLLLYQGASVRAALSKDISLVLSANKIERELLSRL